MTAISLPQLTDALLTLDAGVATLTFNRDDVRNELTGSALVDDIETVVSWVNREAAVSALIVTGAGAAFSAGGNVKHMQNRDGAFAGDAYTVHNRYRQGIQRMSLALNKVEVPLLAAVNGPAIGAGCDLACMCDIRLGSTAAKFGETFVNLGIIPGDGGAYFLQRIVGFQLAAEMTFSGRIVGAEEAKDIGLLLEVVAPEELLPRAQALAASFAAKPPQALRLAKRLMKAAQRMELPDFLDMCAIYQGVCHNTADHLEAVGAFLEKRPPSFTGK